MYIKKFKGGSKPEQVHWQLKQAHLYYRLLNLLY